MLAAASTRTRRIAIVLGVWVVVAGAALLIAAAQDDPVGAGARDAAQPAPPGAVAGSGADTAPGNGTAPGTTTAPEGLPPLALVMAEPPPAAFDGLSAREQAVRLRDAVLKTGGTAPEWVLLGSLLQQLDRGPMAAGAYDAALQIDPADVSAKVGLALVDGATGTAGAARAKATLAELARANPDSQVVAFNQGWLAAYGRQGPAARAAWERTVALGADTRLGLSATTLLQALENGATGRNP